ncbi:MAG: MMPL family transporter [Planctomycetales bacterium]|nr:MMPL family transporter [Planctomycetales bacterium]
MFRVLGQIIARWWFGVLLAWIVLLVTVKMTAPEWRKIAGGGEFAYLPEDVKSRLGEDLLAKAFPHDLLKSSVVIVCRRTVPLTDADEAFIDDVLKPAIEALQAQPNSVISPTSKVKTFKDPLVGKLLVSEDQKASLVIVPLTTEFLNLANRSTINSIAKLVDERTGTLNTRKPAGLDLRLSGSATVGNDMLEAGDKTAKDIEWWTVVLVISLLVLIYRAPLLAFIPLITVAVAVHISLGLVALLTQVPQLGYHIFQGIEVYITVVVYGAGVDYCLFLISRYKEELESAESLDGALSSALSGVGAALVASAGTVICGIGMMTFAQFGKFRQAGVGIALSLCVVLLASLTLTPALLKLAGRFAFWPHGRRERIAESGGWIAGVNPLAKFWDRFRAEVIWEWVGRCLVKRPGLILVGSVTAMFPFAVTGVMLHDFLSYGLLSELPPETQSVVGAKAVQDHFPAGYAGTLTLLLKNDEVDFSELQGDGQTALQQFVEGDGESADGTTKRSLLDRRVELGIADLRYLKMPLGLHASQDLPLPAKMLRNRKALEYYVSEVEGLKGHVTRLDIVFNRDPFARESIEQLTALEAAVRDHLPQLLSRSELLLVGPTASIRDLKIVTDHDQVKIDLLVLGVVFLILVVLLRKPAISCYLILTVFFSYLAALGMTFAVYRCLDGPSFAGLDWKVPMFLFVILIAIGEDYNIFLMARIEEEQRQHGPLEGVRVALLKTSGIISSCGIIMAGTFSSLLASTLVGMKQLGFALAFGILLDTFVVRPILVPAYLIILNSGRLGRLGRWLGGVAP